MLLSDLFTGGICTLINLSILQIISVKTRELAQQITLLVP